MYDDVSNRGLSTRIGGVFASPTLLRAAITIVYGVPLQCILDRTTRPRWHFSAVSTLMLFIQWGSFGTEMSMVLCVWKKTIPFETLTLMVLLVLSGASTFTLFLLYFYNPTYIFGKRGESTISPEFSFEPEGRHVTLAMTRKKWARVSGFLVLGAVGVAFMVFCDAENTFFDFYGIHGKKGDLDDLFNQNSNLCMNGTEFKYLYVTGVAGLFWGFLATAVSCCVFYVACLDIVHHVGYIEELILRRARDFRAAKSYHECLLKYTDNVIGTFKYWFFIHSVFFFLAILCSIAGWVEVVSKALEHDSHIGSIILAEVAGSLVIAFKYAFPMYAASQVTSRFDKMYRRVARECSPSTFPDVDVFMSYCSRCKGGFKLLGVRVTAWLALMALLSSFVGFVRV
ncbi:uncharacterized protein LOC116604430 isoform X1 [Nematostella vectensis]|uniref:uncharacterized protein LOC116604430 isoform X1 n=2 Tax=Nematostella vectensis TaxID=45351 RepID=UPI00207707C3|nr:uncharacterized protein LOC116604430 isoform X1 [Nematostella vectensis]